MFSVYNTNFGAALLSVMGGAVVTYFFTRYGKRIAGRSKKNRVEEIFNGYDRFIIQLQRESSRQEKLIKKMDRHADYLEQLAAKQRNHVNELLAQLDDANKRLDSANAKLQTLKQRYKIPI